ncbi:MAG: hypothetical protein P4L53_25910 [Candidatus Obscuribacterales bacterium]|nr:hypothetical protein [Candidatus Obscuribacterales bacterium]
MQTHIKCALSNLVVLAIYTTCVHAASTSNETVIKLNNEGVKKINSGDLKGAVSDFNEALKIQPDYDLAYQNKFIVYRKLKDYTSTIADFEKLQKNSSFASYPVNLEWIGEAYADQGVRRQKSGDISGALESFEKASLYSPDSSEYLHFRGVARQTAGDIKRGREDLELEKAISLNKKGVTKMNSGDLEGAIIDFGQALEIKPDYAAAYRNKFLAYHKMKAYATMIDSFETLSKNSKFKPDYIYLPFLGDAYADQGLSRQKSGDMAGALKSFEKANLYSPGMAEYLHYRGIAKRATGDTRGAKEDFEAEKQSFSLKSRD